MTEQGTSEWLEERLGYFTASNCFKLIGKGKGGEDFGEVGMTYILDKIGERLSGQTNFEYETAAMKWGTENEPLAREWYCRKHGMVVDEVGFIKHPTLENFGGSPDGIAYKVGSGDEAGLLEIKCPFTFAAHLNHCLIESQEYFKKYFAQYYWQVVGNMMCNNLKWADFVSFDPRLNSKIGLFIFRLERNEDDVALLTEKITKANSLMQTLEKKLTT